MSLWDLGVAEGGLAVAIVLGIALHSALPNVPKPKVVRNCFWAAWAVFCGVAVMWGITIDEYSLLPRLLIVGLLSAIAGVGAVESARFIMHKEKPLKVTATAPAPFESQGGKGGDAKVGGSGIAIGGPGGPAGKYGRGGDGGGGNVAGDGIAAGGEGGAAGDDNVWRPPARSGYEVYMEQTGQAPDPFMKQFGRGGANGGYVARFQVIERLRSEYFQSNSQTPESVSENINAVPLDYLNETLAIMDETWRVRIVRGQYEFFIPTEALR